MVSSAAGGSSYGSEIPVNSGIWPERAFAYSPLRSRDSHTSIGVLMCTSTKSAPAASAMRRASARSASYGAIGAAMPMPPCRATSAATNPIRRMFTDRSAREKPSPLESSRRTTSPSNSDTVRVPSSSSAS